MSEIRNRTIDGIKVGDSFSATRTFTEQDVKQFADISKDYNPVHLDDRFAGVKKFSGRVCHGLLVGSMLTEIGGQMGMLASSMTFVFKKPVYFGDTIECCWTFTEIDDNGRAEAEAEFRNQRGVMVLTATVTGIIPGNSEKEVLRAMVAEGDPTNKLSGK